MDRLFLQTGWLVEQFLANDQDLPNGPASIKTRVRYNHFSVLHMIWIIRMGRLLARRTVICNNFLQEIHKSRPLARRTVHLGKYFFKPARILLPGFDGEVSSKMGSRRVTMTSCWEGERGGGRQAASLSKFFTSYMFIE